MDRLDLLTVEDTFLLEGGKTSMLVIAPCVPCPLKSWKNWEGSVTVMKPDGSEAELPARLQVAHFNIRDPQAPMSDRWKIVMTLPDRSKDEVPIGSRIACPLEIVRALLGPEADEPG